MRVENIMAPLTMLAFVHGLSISSLPTGTHVMSRLGCISLCYLNTTCSSVFFNSDAKTCHQTNAVYAISQETGPVSGLQYFVWTSGYCGQGYIWYRSLGLCYKVDPTEKTWQAAEDQCVLDGGHLISVDSSAVNDFMNWLVGVHGKPIWTGGIEGTDWTWADNSVMETTFWASGQPGGVEHCLGVYAPEGNPTNKWHDIGCNSNVMSVCQGPVADSLC